MKISVITPTGGRALSFKLCELWMSRQTRQPDEWIVVDDYPIPTECTMGQTIIRRKPFWSPNAGVTLVKNLIEALKVVTGDIIIIIEDDDWYHPDYIKTVAQKFERPMEENRFPHLVGSAISLYYNVKNCYYLFFNNINHTGLCSTSFSSKLIPQVNILANYFSDAIWFDAELWKYSRCNKLTFFSKNPLVIGIKGMPGRHGAGIGHKTLPLKDEQPFELLEKFIGKENTQIYKKNL